MSDIDDKSNDVSIHDNETHDAVTTENISGKRGLHTYLINPDLSVSSGAKIRYSELAKNVSLTQGSYQTIFSTTDAGLIYSVILLFKLSDVDIKISLDSTAIVNGINIDDIKNNYSLNSDTGTVVQLPKFIYSYGNRGILFEFPAPANFTSTFLVEAKSNVSSNEIERGLVIRTIN